MVFREDEESLFFGDGTYVVEEEFLYLLEILLVLGKGVVAHGEVFFYKTVSEVGYPLWEVDVQVFEGVWLIMAFDGVKPLTSLISLT